MRRLSPSATGATRPLERAASACFWLVCVAFLYVLALLASHARYAGGPDSLNNLSDARNIARGEGFTSHIIQQLAVPEALPGPELARAPGLPYLLSALFLLFGESLRAALWFNGLIVLATAVALRRVALTVGSGWLASAVAMLYFVGGRNYELNSLVTNNLLCLISVGFLAVAAGNIRGARRRAGSRGTRTAGGCGVLRETDERPRLDPPGRGPALDRPFLPGPPFPSRTRAPVPGALRRAHQPVLAG